MGPIFTVPATGGVVSIRTERGKGFLGGGGAGLGGKQGVK